MIFEFDVAVSTHDLLKEGVVRRHWTRVAVSASGYQEARLIALQMAACGGWMPTDAVCVGVDEPS